MGAVRKMINSYDGDFDYSHKFANEALARKLAEKSYPDAKTIEIITHGYENIVAIVDNNYAIRFPRNEDAYKADKYEEAILAELRGSIGSVQIPKILEEKTSPTRFLTNFIEGKHLSRAEVNGMPKEAQLKFAADFAIFANELHRALSVNKINALREKFDFNETELDYYEKDLRALIFEKQFPTLEQEKTAKKYYQLFKELKFIESFVAVHSDLHLDNLFFKDHNLSGVLDFACTEVGPPEQEFRQLFRINKLILETALKKYEKLSGKKLDMRTVEVLSIIQELASYCHYFFSGETDHPSFARACENLNEWFETNIWR